MQNRFISITLILMVSSLMGCSDAFLTGNVRETMSLGPSQAIATNADVRLVHRFAGQERRLQMMPDTANPTGGMTRMLVTHPREYLCAEPSPDVARAVQAAVGLSGSLGVEASPPAGAGIAVDARLAAQLSASRAESVAQLTKRIATIQLLRDGMYRACEAYANGAIGKEIYTAIVSRYDTTMITMLLAEMAAGNFGSAATLGGFSDASGSASASSAGVRAAEARATQITTEWQGHVTRKARLEVQKKSLDPTKDADKITALDAQIAAEDALMADAEARKNDAQQAVKDAKVAGAASTAGGTAGAGANANVSHPTVTVAKEIAEVLYRMQRAYINDPRSGSLFLMCFSELADVEAVGSEMRDTCRQLRTVMLSPSAIQQSSEGKQRALLTELGNERISALGSALKDLIGNKTITATQAAAIVQAVGGPTTEPYRR